MSVEEFLQKVAWPGVQPSPLGGGEGSAAQEPQLDQEDDSSKAIPTPPEPFIVGSSGLRIIKKGEGVELIINVS